MKKGILASYVYGIKDHDHGESFSQITRYFVPEMITALTLYSLPMLLDAWFVAHLKSTSTYATLGITNTLLHFIIKMAEGISVGTIIMSGQYNGAGKLKEVGRTVVDAFWTTLLVGSVISAALFFGAYPLYYHYGLPERMIELGVPFLRIRAIGIFFTFLYFAFIGFLRGIKNTRVPMQIFIAGGILFVIADYVLIFGHCGLPAMNLQGSALASVIQYAFMFCAALFYVVRDPACKKYAITLFSVLNPAGIKRLLSLSWPVMIDKATIAAAYIWLGYVLAPMGKYALASFSVIKDMERLAIIPAAALAQVITFLVSNDFGEQDWDGIKSNIKKTVFMGSIGVFSILLVMSLWPDYFISFFDRKGSFTSFSAAVFPFLSILVFFDLLQLILSAALRGAADVKTVMTVRLAVCFGYFVPVSWMLSQITFENVAFKFLLMYGSFYLGSALMSGVYINRFRGDRWKTKVIKDI